MASDRAREIHGEPSPWPDAPSPGECLIEVREEIARIEGGDLTGIAPWMTKEETLTALREEEARYARLIGKAPQLAEIRSGLHHADCHAGACAPGCEAD